MAQGTRPVGQHNRTTVRFLGAVLRVLSRVAPGLAAALTERAFFTPPRPRPSRGAATLRGARSLRLRVDGRRIAAWRWGEGPMVALVHGWGGQAGQLTSFVPRLLAQGFSVVAFDAPGHGRSSRGMSSAPQFARALRAVAAAVGGRLHGVVAHSLGGAATVLAIRDGLRVDRVVFVAPPADPPEWFYAKTRQLGLDEAIVARARERSERRIGMGWAALKLETQVAGLGQPLLVIHDRHDAEVPLRDGATMAAAWPGARLLETQGLGHNRLLRDSAVVAAAVGFLAEGAPSGPCAGHEHPAGVCAQDLERHLFDREARFAAWGVTPA